MHFLLHSMGSDPYEEPSFHSLTLSPTGYIPSGRCPARSRRIPHSWRGKERTQGLGGHRREGSEKSGRSGPRGEEGKKRGEEKRSWERNNNEKFFLWCCPAGRKLSILGKSYVHCISRWWVSVLDIGCKMERGSDGGQISLRKFPLIQCEYIPQILLCKILKQIRSIVKKIMAIFTGITPEK